jgi:sugar/nucleoside kinase (ribokinase family)
MGILPPVSEDTRQRERVTAAAAQALGDALPSLKARTAFVGFDGFIDVIIRVVDRRRTMVYEDYEPIRTIAAYSERVAAAAGRSANLELVTIERRFGGNGPLLAGALGRLGLTVDYVGAVGSGVEPTRLDPLFEPFAARCRSVAPVGPPCVTEACEFDDGKLMFGHTANAGNITWDRVRQTVGLDRLVAMLDEASLLGMVNWTMFGGLEGIWRGLVADVFPRLSKRERRIFIDLSDPAKRTDADLGHGLGMVSQLDTSIPVTLGLNLAESQRIARVLGVEAARSGEQHGTGDEVARAAARVRASLGIHRVVIHRRDGAGAADAAGDSAWFDGPFTQNPLLSTGAGDHFNAGFAAAEQIGMPINGCLATACATSGLYVREGQSPTGARVASFLESLPVPER